MAEAERRTGETAKENRKTEQDFQIIIHHSSVNAISYGKFDFK